MLEADRSFKYKYLPEHRYFMAQQLWESSHDLTIYTRQSFHEFDEIQPFLPENPKVVMDLGCGLGRMGVFLSQAVYKDPEAFYLFADATGDVDQNTGNFGAGEIYNDLALTASFAELNGVKRFTVFNTLKENFRDIVIGPFDLIISVCSFGVHVPIDPYLEDLITLLAPGGTMIFGVREHYDEGSFNGRFREHHFRRVPQEAQYAHQNWLVLRDPK
jgi:SAM-dependent methyltransferase